MNKNSRTSDVFEEIPAYQKPPLIELSDPDDLSEIFEGYGIKDDDNAKKIVRRAIKISGLKSYHKKLRNTLEDTMRKTNVRTPGLFAPAIAATLALKDESNEQQDPIERAARLIFAARSLHSDVISGKLAPDTLNDQILEMGEYPNLFSTNMVISKKGVSVFKSKIVSKILIVFRGNYYIVDMGDTSEEVSLDKLYSTLSHIVRSEEQKEHAERMQMKTNEYSVGVLTAASDSTQISAFKDMLKNKANRNTLNNINNIFFTICLDLDQKPESYASAARLAHSGNYSNRWYHSSFQLVVFGNAKACAIFNFTAYLDGNVMMRAGAEIQSRALRYNLNEISPEALGQVYSCCKLELKVEKRYIEKALAELRQLEDKQQSTFEIKDIGQKEFSALKLQAVPAFIVALQMALKNLTDKSIPISQFLSMSKYRCMDLSVVKVTTKEVTRFVEYMQKDQIDDEKARILLKEAIESQKIKCRRVREHLPLDDILTYYIKSRGKLFRMYIFAVMIITLRVLRKKNLIDIKKGGYDVIVSHPEIYQQVPIVGRPGVKFPGANYFALHYQIWNERIVLTFMQAVSAEIPNAKINSEINYCLQRIISLYENAYSSGFLKSLSDKV